jgi:hypothetical protein
VSIALIFTGFAYTAFATTTASTTAETVTETTPLAVSGPQITIETIPGTDIAIGDFVVGPGRVEVSVRPGETVYRDITVTNRISAGRTFDLVVEDMSGSASGDEAVVLLGDQKGPYSLRDYISFPQESITLGLGERARVPVAITMPPNAEPGGYYGGVLVSTSESDVNPSDGLARSPIIARVGTLFFITVPGPTTMLSELTNFDTLSGRHLFTEGPISFGVTYENKGSVHTNPSGELRIYNTFNREVGYVEIDPWFVLPQSIRTREIIWNTEMLLGRYRAEVSIKRGYSDEVDTKSVVFWVLPWQVIGAAFAGLFVFFLLIRLFFSRFELKRK